MEFARVVVRFANVKDLIPKLDREVHVFIIKFLKPNAFPMDGKLSRTNNSPRHIHQINHVGIGWPPCAKVIYASMSKMNIPVISQSTNKVNAAAEF